MGSNAGSSLGIGHERHFGGKQQAGRRQCHHQRHRGEEHRTRTCSTPCCARCTCCPCSYRPPSVCCATCVVSVTTCTQVGASSHRQPAWFWAGAPEGACAVRAGHNRGHPREPTPRFIITGAWQTGREAGRLRRTRFEGPPRCLCGRGVLPLGRLQQPPLVISVQVLGGGPGRHRPLAGPVIFLCGWRRASPPVLPRFHCHREHWVDCGSLQGLNGGTFAPPGFQNAMHSWQTLECTVGPCQSPRDIQTHSA